MNCNRCQKEFKDNDSVYHIEVTNYCFPDVESGPIEEKLNYCDDCYFMWFDWNV